MVEKINGMVNKGQFLTGNLDFYTVRTTLDIRATGVISDASQKRLDKLVETISLRAQPVFMGEVALAEDVVATDIPAAGSAATDVYTLLFAIEHAMAWDVEGSANPTLAETLDGIEGFVFDIAVTNDNNVAIAKVAGYTL